MHGCTQGAERNVAPGLLPVKLQRRNFHLNLARLFTVWSSLMPERVPDHTIGFDVTSPRRAK
jgi:hypothetical protein